MLSILVAQALSIPIATQAGNVTVNTSADDTATNSNCTFREAIQSVNTGYLQDACSGSGTLNGINFNVAGNTVTLTQGQITLDNAAPYNNPSQELTIDGLTVSGGRVTLDGDGNGTILAMISGWSVTLDHMRLTGGYANNDGGALYAYQSTLTVSNSVITGNSAEDGGGGIYANQSTLSVVTSTISGNTVTLGGRGGGLKIKDSSFTIDQSTASGNSTNGSTVSAGGGIHVLDSTGTLVNSTISGNTSYSSGGGIVISNSFGNSSSVGITNSTISDNTITTGSGAVSVSDDVSLPGQYHHRQHCRQHL